MVSSAKVSGLDCRTRFCGRTRFILETLVVVTVWKCLTYFTLYYTMWCLRVHLGIGILLVPPLYVGILAVALVHIYCQRLKTIGWPLTSAMVLFLPWLFYPQHFEFAALKWNIYLPVSMIGANGDIPLGIALIVVGGMTLTMLMVPEKRKTGV